jgi:hypothetical protein
MLELATVVREVGEEYRQRFSDHMLPSHLRALRDIEHCRTAVLGGQLYRCDGCAREQYGYHSCQNRACPKCQSERTKAWLLAQQERLLPCEHFLFTFTLPQSLRPVARSHQKLIYDALLRCAADAILTLANDPRHLGARPAVLAVLHTHGRDLGYHPHAHLLVSAGGLDPNAERFVANKYPRFLFPARVLSVLFRQKLRGALERAALTNTLPDALWHKPWVVHAQHAGSGQQVLSYLGRYLFKSPLPNSRIEHFENGNVTFRFRSHRTGKTVHQTLPALSFLQRLLQHVLPARLHHVRGYGLLSPACKPLLLRAHELLPKRDAATAQRPGSQPRCEGQLSEQPQPLAHSHRCPFCNSGRMHIIARLTPEQTIARAALHPPARSPP